MSIIAPPPQLEQGYEALRAQAVGDIPTLTPRGLAVFLRGGLAAWMCACPPLVQMSPAVTPASRRAVLHSLAGVSSELVQLLAEMTTSRQRRCWT